jgi:hypothetical protein
MTVSLVLKKNPATDDKSDVLVQVDTSEIVDSEVVPAVLLNAIAWAMLERQEMLSAICDAYLAEVKESDDDNS